MTSPSFSTFESGRRVSAELDAAELRFRLNSLGLTSRALKEYEIAEWHLTCATDLPGSEELDIGRSLAQIDDYSRIVCELTRANHWKFLEHPECYHHSDAYFCALHLVTVLWKICGLQYHPKWCELRPEDGPTPNTFLGDSREGFLHGVLDGPGGTCASIPVLVVAIGRRLGYPLYIVKAMKHLFARWSDPKGRWRGMLGQSPCRPTEFNIEATNHGLHTPSNDEYRTWPKRIDPLLMDSGAYLTCLTPPEEISESLMARGICLCRHNRWGEAIAALRWAADLAPHNPLRAEHLEQVEELARRRSAISL